MTAPELEGPADHSRGSVPLNNPPSPPLADYDERDGGGGGKKKGSTGARGAERWRMAFAIGTALTGLGLMTFPIVWITVGHEKFVEDLAGKAFSDWTVAWLAGSKAAICMASVFGGLRLVEAARHLTLPLEMHYQLESASIAHRQPPNERKVGERLGLATEQLAGVMMAPVKTVAHQVGGVAAAAMDGAKKQDTEGPNKLNPSS